MESYPMGPMSSLSLGRAGSSPMGGCGHDELRFLLRRVDDGLEELRGSVQVLQGSMVYQGEMLAEVQKAVCPFGGAGTLDFEEPQKGPSKEPPMLPLVPGEVEQARRVSFEKPRKKKIVRRPPMPKPGGHASTMLDLESHMAQELLRKRSASFRSSSKVSESGEDDASLSSVVEPVVERPRTTVTAEKEGVLKMCRRLSLNELEASHAAHLARTPGPDHTQSVSNKLTLATVDTDGESMDCTGRSWLLSVGILGFESRRLSSAWFTIICFFLLALLMLLIYFIAMGQVDVHHACMTLCYLVGVTLATHGLRRGEIQLLLGHENGGLEDYARKSGFLTDWRQVSRQRLWEVLALLSMMLSCKWLCLRHEVSMEELTAAVCFTAAALGWAAVVYAQLHLVAGMELAIDCFSISFFQEMDLEHALQEWNTVQATLRQVSTKLSLSLLASGASCGACLLLLAEYIFFHPEAAQEELRSAADVAIFLGWLFPPVLLFLYAMMRAASVTEKASRVAPLVNSWTFQGTDTKWMDEGRQYMVQYMRQSEAGFYLQGMRLHVFQVTKLCYYFAAFMFAVLSKSTFQIP